MTRRRSRRALTRRWSTASSTGCPPACAARLVRLVVPQVHRRRGGPRPRRRGAPTPGRLLLLRQPPGTRLVAAGRPAAPRRAAGRAARCASWPRRPASRSTADDAAPGRAERDRARRRAGSTGLRGVGAGVDDRARRRRRRGVRGGLAPARRPAAADRRRPPGCSATTASARAPSDRPVTAADASGVCAVVLAAGEGQRLRPLTELRAQGAVPGRQRAAARPGAGPGRRARPRRPRTVAVNACYLGEQVVAHVGDRAHVSVEPGDPLGTAGRRSASLRDWIDGRGVLVGNADAYLADPAAPPGPDIAALLDGWDGDDGTPARRARPARRPGEFGGAPVRRVLAAALAVRARPAGRARPSWSATVWRPAEAAGRAGGGRLPRHLPRHRHARPTTWPPTCTRPAAASWSTRRRRGHRPGRAVGGRRRRAGAGAVTRRGGLARRVRRPPASTCVDAIRAGGDLTVAG